MYGYYKEKSHVNHFWASGSFNRIWRCYENVVSGHLTSADQEFYHDNSIEAVKKKNAVLLIPSAEIQPYCAILEFFLLYVGDVMSSDLSKTFDAIVQF